MIHQANNLYTLWEAFERESGTIQPVPFWGIVWPGARMLIEYINSNPHLVKGKKVLDIGAGCGAVAIAAAINGASSVTTNDIDKCALHVISRNASANNVSVILSSDNFSETHPPEPFDIVFLADMFYKKSEIDAFKHLFTATIEKGASIFIADAARPFTPISSLQPLKTKSFPVDTSIEGGDDSRNVTLYVYSDSSC